MPKTIDNTGNEPENNDANYDELDDILNDDKENIVDDKDKKDDSEKDDEKSDKNKDKDEEESNKFFKKIGTHEFSNEKDFDEFVSKTYHTNSQLAGEVKKLGGNPKKPSGEEQKIENKKKDEQEVKKEKTPEESYYEIENIRFMKRFPDAKEYRDEMTASIKNGRASINEEPSYALAFAKALRGDGKSIPDNLLKIIKMEKGEDINNESQSVTKKIMRSGGQRTNIVNEPEQESYSKDDLEEVSDFGDKVALGGF